MLIPEVTPELCAVAVEAYVTPMFEANIKSNVFGRRDGSLIIASLPTESSGTDMFDEPSDAFRNAAVIYEHSWGRTHVDEADFSLKALQKVFGAWKFKKDYDQVLAENSDFIEQHNLIKFPGGIVRNVAPSTPGGVPKSQLLVAGYAGLWWWHDAMIAGQTLDGIKAELTRQSNERA